MRFFIVLSLAAVATAQTPPQTNGQTPSAAASGAVVGGGGNILMPFQTSVISLANPGEAVTGAPYSAEEVTEHVQTLADGTHITQPSPKTVFYRDSLGRTRIERTFPMPPGASGDAGPNMIEISDPTTGAHYTLNPHSRTARTMFFPSAPPPPPPPPGVTRPAVPQVQVATRPLPLSLPGSQPQRPQFSHEPLGTQTIDGVLAEGSRTTVTFPIGMVGNDRPVTTVSEEWTSTELKTVVLRKNSDPRSGESTTRLTNISRVEPDPSLFQIPSDYEIVNPLTPGR